MIEALDIHVKGIVQGVGFRPFVYRMAKKYLVNGWVLNAADGVSIHAEAEGKLLDQFVIELSENAPEAARVEEIELHEVPLEDFDTFEIRFSDEGAVEKTTLVSPDLATCDDCLAELLDPSDRRYRYPFINCTNCGPRFTIIDSLPYDRKSTSMADFAMCEPCAREYADPSDRRFHAQPDACFDCGPHLSWVENPQLSPEAMHALTCDDVAVAHAREESDAMIARAVELLLAGKIVAVKGLGGFHLVCDADNEDALRALRERKHREGKAFAVMMQDVAAVKDVCRVNAAERMMLESAARPIVLVRKRVDASLAKGLADGLPELGAMLPCTPLQQLLIRDFAQAKGGARAMLVMTSGNVHDEPIEVDDGRACCNLARIAEGFLGNDRAILSRYDDSVVRVAAVGEENFAVQFVRRARGYAPFPLQLPQGAPAATPLLATGPEQKNTFTLVRESEAFVSQHIGDMENAETYDAWLEAKARYERLFEVEPALLVCDMHPEYLSTKWAVEQDEPRIEIQHHHAHIASVIGEHALSDPVCGIAFDGTGYGVDGAVWGGEVLLANSVAFERFANFSYVPMPGGAAAVKNPLRMAYGALWEFDLLEHPAAWGVLEQLGAQADMCDQMIEKGINTPVTSSVGRLFDAASSILGICPQPTYEGEPAIMLEAAADALVAAEEAAGNASLAGLGLRRDDEASAEAVERYTIAIVKNTATAASTAQDTSVLLLDAAPVFQALLDDMAAGVDKALIACRFHGAFVRAIADVAELVRNFYEINVVALSGGVFMNRLLLESVLALLEERGFVVAVNRDLPPNDGCISYGQAVIACAMSNASE